MKKVAIEGLGRIGRLMLTMKIVSAGIIGNPHSGIVDALSTRVVMNRVAKVLVWYDNEFGHERRVLDLAAYV